MAYTISDISLLFGVYLIAALAKGVTGLGFSTTCLPMLVLIFGLKPTLPFLIIPSIASNLLVMSQAGEFKVTLKQFWPLYLTQVPGVLIGLSLLLWLAPYISTAILGITLIIYCSFTLSNPEFQLPNHLQRRLALPTGFLTGVINGFTGSQVMPLLPYMLSLGLSPSRFVQAINCSFTLSSLFMALGLFELKLMTLEIVLISMMGIIPVYIGTKIGSKTREHLNLLMFRRLVLISLILMGCALTGQFLS